MVFFLIFNILCLLASLGMSIMVAKAIAFWRPVSHYLEGNNGHCTTEADPYDFGRNCVCLSGNKGWTLCK